MRASASAGAGASVKGADTARARPRLRHRLGKRKRVRYKVCLFRELTRRLPLSGLRELCAGSGVRGGASVGAMFAVGHPTALASPAARGDAPVVALERDARAETTALVTSSSLEVGAGVDAWAASGGRPRRSPMRARSSPRSGATAGTRSAVVAEGGVYLYHLAFHDGPETVAGVAVRFTGDSAPRDARASRPRACRCAPPAAVVRRVLGASSANGVPPLSPVIEDAAAANDGACVLRRGRPGRVSWARPPAHLVQFDWDRRGGLGDRDGDSNAGDERPERGKGGKGAGRVEPRGPAWRTPARFPTPTFAGERRRVGGGRGAPRGDGAAAVLRLDDHGAGRGNAPPARAHGPRVAKAKAPRWCPRRRGRDVRPAGAARGIDAASLSSPCAALPVTCTGLRGGLAVRMPAPRDELRRGGSASSAPESSLCYGVRRVVSTRRRRALVPRRRRDRACGTRAPAIAVWSRASLCRLMCTLDVGASGEAPPSIGKPSRRRRGGGGARRAANRRRGRSARGRAAASESAGPGARERETESKANRRRRAR